MARPKKHTVDYFPHSCNHKKTMYIIENKYGNDGYAFWFKLLELLGQTEGHFYDCNNPADWEFLLAKTRVNEEIAIDILKTLASLEAIDPELWGGKLVWSDNFLEGITDVYKRRDSLLPQKPSLCQHEPHPNDVSANISTQSKVKETKEKKSKEIAISFSKEFLEVWKEYPPGSKGSKKEAMKSWKKTNGQRPDNLIEIFGVQKAQRDDLRAAGEFVAPWKHFSTYLNQACWDEIFGKEEKESERERILREAGERDKTLADVNEADGSILQGPEIYTR